MAQKNKKTLFVIFHGQRQHGGPGTRYIARDGTTTKHKSRAATFGTAHDAITFAKEKGITFDGAVNYIGQEDFTDWDLRPRS